MQVRPLLATVFPASKPVALTCLQSWITLQGFSTDEDERLHSVREFEKRSQQLALRPHHLPQAKVKGCSFTNRTSALENIVVAMESSHRPLRAKRPCFLISALIPQPRQFHTMSPTSFGFVGIGFSSRVCTVALQLLSPRLFLVLVLRSGFDDTEGQFAALMLVMFVPFLLESRASSCQV